MQVRAVSQTKAVLARALGTIQGGVGPLQGAARSVVQDGIEVDQTCAQAARLAAADDAARSLVTPCGQVAAGVPVVSVP